MLSDKVRYCDVCDEEIPKGTKYQKVTMPPEGAELLASRQDPELVPSWTTNADGTITMDICLTCSISMGSREEGPPA